MTDQTSIADRLRIGLRESRRSIRWLTQMVRERDVRGSSHSSVQSYVSGSANTDPPIEFLRAAAELLGVREAWLISGEGLATEEQEKIRLANLFDPKLQVTTVGIPRDVQSLYVDLIDALTLAVDGPVPMTLQPLMSQQLVHLIHAPLGRCGLPAHGDMTDAALRSYIAAAITALAGIVPEPHSVKPADLKKTLTAFEDEMEVVAKWKRSKDGRSRTS